MKWDILESVCQYEKNLNGSFVYRNYASDANAARKEMDSLSWSSDNVITSPEEDDKNE